MNIGFVSAWGEQGSAYVTKQYIRLLETENNIFVYERNSAHQNCSGWKETYVTKGLKTYGAMRIFWPQFKRWVKRNKLDIIFFNEQQDMDILALLKRHMPDVKIGAYIDYYKEDTVEKHRLYDFLICNTMRHYSVFKWHKQCSYIPWGTDTELYLPAVHNKELITFFHSAGNSPTRKGTLPLLEVFLGTDLWEKSQLIIHIQNDELLQFGYSYDELACKNVKVINKTVTAPGLYYMGDVYVYPTLLDGLGLTIYEALSCGLPVVGTDVPPINEIIVDGESGKLVDVEKSISRADGYYWPLSFVNKDSLYLAMKYYVDNTEKIQEIKRNIREQAVKKYSWGDRSGAVKKAFYESKVLNDFSKEYLDSYIKKKSIGDYTNIGIYFCYLNIKELIKKND